MSRQSSDEVWAAAFTGVAMAAVIGLLVLLAYTATELVRIYAARATDRSRVAGLLWSALAALLLTWLTASVLAADPHLQAPAAHLAAWGFLLFTLFVEGVDQWARRQERAEAAGGQQLEDYLHLPERESAEPTPPTIARPAA